MLLIRFILLPISLIYALVIIIRNKLYDWKILASTKFDLPIISIGNITVGGTGKTPHIAYLISLLKEKYKIAVLSRGYGRLTKGFKLVDEHSTATIVGDEPFMLKQKYADILVAVDESRVNGITSLREKDPTIQAILLDDAFQHRAVKVGLSIVLVDYNQPIFNDFLLPAGRLRETKSGLARADIIIVSKTPSILEKEKKEEFERKLNLQAHQKLFFSYLEYGNLISLDHSTFAISTCKEYDCLLLTGIANAQPLKDYISTHFNSIKHLAYRDHYSYSLTDVKAIKKQWEHLKTEKKLLLTTEKDFVKLNKQEFKDELNNVMLYYIPIEVKFYESLGENFNAIILNYLSK